MCVCVCVRVCVCMYICIMVFKGVVRSLPKPFNYTTTSRARTTRCVGNERYPVTLTSFHDYNSLKLALNHRYLWLTWRLSQYVGKTLSGLT